MQMHMQMVHANGYATYTYTYTPSNCLRGVAVYEPIS